jgi:predicted DNA-binding protein YlxM (UPF0122 family)
MGIHEATKNLDKSLNDAVMALHELFGLLAELGDKKYLRLLPKIFDPFINAVMSMSVIQDETRNIERNAISYAVKQVIKSMHLYDVDTSIITDKTITQIIEDNISDYISITQNTDYPNTGDGR